MCMSVVQKVLHTSADYAIMTDGRKVVLGSLKNVKPGDNLEVFANLAVAKVSKITADSIYSMRGKQRKGRV
jgi:hypothetical protein